MKSLSEYAIFNLFEKKEEEDFSETLKKLYDFLIENLQDKESLEDYVAELNETLKKKDAAAILNKAFGEATSGYKFKGKVKALPVKNLHPSQSEIDIKNSLGFPFTHGKDVAAKNARRYYKNNVVKMPFPLITFNETNILDGHHRWSQTYAFNKNAKMQCIDITVAGDKNLSSTDMLKIVQGFMAARIAEKGKEKLPSSDAKPERNIFSMSPAKLKEWVDSYVNNKKYKDAVAELMKYSKSGTKEVFSNLLVSNLNDLIDKNDTYIKKAAAEKNTRDVMPQTDEGGKDSDNIDAKFQSALPSTPGSALNKMLKGKADNSVVKK